VSVERRTIRCYLAEKLVGRTRAGSNVRPQRFDPILPERELDGVEVFAALMVYGLSETLEVHADSPRTYARELELAVEVFVQAGPELDAEAVEDLVDDVCDQVECVVDAELPQLLRVRVPGTQETLSVNPSHSRLLRVEVGFDAKGVQLAGAARLVWAVAYSTDVDERLQARATDLETVRATYRFPPVDLEAPPAAEDEIDLAGG
jgi:hypothetical protein